MVPESVRPLLVGSIMATCLFPLSSFGNSLWSRFEPEDQLSPRGGLLALFAALAYPVYILIMNLGIHAFSEGEAKAH